MCYGPMKPRLNYLAIMPKGMFGAKNNTAHHPQNTIPTVSVVVEASCFRVVFLQLETEALVKVVGIMKNSKHRSNFAENLQASVRKLKIFRPFQHVWLHQKIKVLEWASQGPDLNPIEHLGGSLKRVLTILPNQDVP